MRNVNGGHMLRYLQQNGAMLFFAAVYIPHLPWPVLRRANKSPRRSDVGSSGIFIYLAMMATAFMGGYVLPWGSDVFLGVQLVCYRSVGRGRASAIG